jgi:hypothetical protein
MKVPSISGNDHIIFNVGTPSIEARNIRLVNIITSIIEESKLISECHSLLNFVSHASSFMYFRHFYIDS